MNFLNNLKIRDKLILFMLLPMITISYFAITGIIEKRQQLNNYQSSLNFLNIALNLIDFVHESQKERGMSIVYHDSRAKLFKIDLNSQRKLTDQAYENFHHKLQLSGFKPDSWGLKNEFEQLQHLLSQLPKIRSKIDSLEDVKIIQFYSNLNALSINIVQVFHVFTDSIELSKQGNAYTSLLWIQERSGRERALLNGVFIQDKLSAKLFRQISADIESQKILFNNYYNVAPTEYRVLLDEVMSFPVMKKVENLRGAAINKMTRNELLNKMLILTGYNGLIHDFKNYVIRGNKIYLERFKSKLKDVKAIILQYKALPSMSVLDLKNLDTVEDTLDKYHLEIQKIKNLHDSRVKISDIDTQVQVDDEPAIKAINYLRSGLSKQDVGIWWQASTERINFIKRVSDKLRVDILNSTKKMVQTSEKALTNYFLVLIVTFIISFVLGWLVIKRLVGELGNISFSLKRMTDEKQFKQSLMISGEDEIGVLAKFYNQLIAERNLAEDKLYFQANYDSLTQLPNRFLSLDRLSNLIRDAKRNNSQIAVLFIDLDDFKNINDSLSHEVGDKLLIQAAKRFQGLIREQDTAGRLGGDEFLVMLGGISDFNDVRSIAENIINNFRIPFVIDGREIVLTLSLGISIFPNDGDTATALLRKSDSAMFRSKDDGKNAYNFFTDEMNKEITRRLKLEEQLHGALERGEFTVFYQPKIDLSSDKIMGAEALIRWHNSSVGHVSPEEFIPLVEQMGLIIPIGEFVLKQALSITEKIQKKFDRTFCMAVNISPRQFRDRSLFLFIQELLDKNNLDGKYLELEITEGLLMSGDDHINKTLNFIGEKGINIAMDDFGTGYSSLSYLRDYPFSVLKIDRSFIYDMNTVPEDKELVNAAISMAHGLNLKVVAEGIETEEQLKLLKEMGCDLGQGYFYSQPVPEEDFIKFFNE